MLWSVGSFRLDSCRDLLMKIKSFSKILARSDDDDEIVVNNFGRLEFIPVGCFLLLLLLLLKLPDLEASK